MLFCYKIKLNVVFFCLFETNILLLNYNYLIYALFSIETQKYEHFYLTNYYFIKLYYGH